MRVDRRLFFRGTPSNVTPSRFADFRFKFLISSCVIDFDTGLLVRAKLGNNDRKLPLRLGAFVTRSSSRHSGISDDVKLMTATASV